MAIHESSKKILALTDYSDDAVVWGIDGAYPGIRRGSLHLYVVLSCDHFRHFGILS